METIDAKGLACPVPVIKAKKALTNHDEVQVIVDNDISVENLTTMARRMGYQAASSQNPDKSYSVDISKNGQAPSNNAQVAGTIVEAPIATTAGGGEQQIAPSSAAAIRLPQGYIAVIDKETMGEGNDQLGGILLKSFIYSLTEQEVLPEYVIFYNGGVKLLLDDSESLDDIQTLKDHGVKIYACGTCVDFYQLKDKIRVAEITNMFDITEIMRSAQRILKP